MMFRRVLAVSPNSRHPEQPRRSGIFENRDVDAVGAPSHRHRPGARRRAASWRRLREARGQAKAIEEWREALRIRPDFEDPRANLDKVGAR
jgi:hypothetical protein